MIRFVIIPLVLILLLLAGLFYIGDEETVQFIGLGKNIEVSLQVAILGAIAGMVGLIALWSLIGWLWRLPGRVKSGVGLRRRNQALDACEDALIAGAEGDAGRARKKSERARALIKSEALGRMISAQAAEAAGDSEEAVAQYTAMLDDERTVTTAQRGLAQQLLASGDLNGAITHAKTAYADNKNAKWAFDTLFQAQTADYRWHAASETLTTGEKRKHINKDVSRRRRAALLTAEADRLDNGGQSSEAAELAVMAASAAPEFAPATALAARLLKRRGDGKKAANLIEKAWAQSPHPALAIAYRDIFSGESTKARAKRVAALIKANPLHRESVIFGAEEALSAGDAVGAWSALAPLLKQDEPSARLCTLAAEAEGMLNNPSDARIWLERAATAPAEADWSDLDPAGDAFDYTDQDWRRLVFTFGEKGALIHPRFEVGAPRRKPILTLLPETKNGKSADVPLRQPDDPGPIDRDFGGDIDKDDLADRLDSLLGDPPKE